MPSSAESSPRRDFAARSSWNSRRISLMEQKSAPDLPLEGQCILVAEDEFLIATVIEDTLREAGADTRRAANVRAALQDIDYKTPSAALLDVRLGRQTSEEVADSLTAR